MHRRFSYNDYTTTKYGDLNEDGQIEDLRQELIKKDDGCVGFLGICGFASYFDGAGNSIENIYRCDSKAQFTEIGLFETYSGNSPKRISNLNLTGTIINTNTSGLAAGIFAGSCTEITNCSNYADVTGGSMVGGIASSTSRKNNKLYKYGGLYRWNC